MILSLSTMLLAFATSGPLYVYVDQRELDCVVRNIDLYLGDPDNPSIIELDECAQVERRQTLPPARAYPRLPAVGRAATAPPRIDRVISLTRAQMLCLKRGRPSLRQYQMRQLGAVYRLPIDFCAAGSTR